MVLRYLFNIKPSTVITMYKPAVCVLSCIFSLLGYSTVSSGELLKLIGNKPERSFIVGLKNDASRMTFGFDACNRVNQLKCIVSMSIAGC